jgi:hypothetical protein
MKGTFWDVMVCSQFTNILEEEQSSACHLLLDGYLLVLLFHPEDRGGTFLQNISELLPEYTVSHPRR